MRQLSLALKSRRGRPRKPGAPVYHVRRPPIPARFPLHVTLRLRPEVGREVGSLRKRRFIAAFRRTLRPACEQGQFRVVHYSIQTNHLHLIVEAAGKQALGRGMKSIAIRFARAVNRVFARLGPVLHGRYALRILATQREVRHALAYVLLNVRKHWFERYGVAPPVRLDEASSGRWFDGWSGARPPPDLPSCEVAKAHTYFLRQGWRRHGLIRRDEVPGLRRSLRQRRRRARSLRASLGSGG
jgi:REP element-mobilizing transposase RayT